MPGEYKVTTVNLYLKTELLNNNFKKHILKLLFNVESQILLYQKGIVNNFIVFRDENARFFSKKIRRAGCYFTKCPKGR